MRVAAAILTLATVAATLATIGTGPALAEETNQIRYHDLNLAAPAGRTTLDARIRGAARRVCGVVPAAPLEEIQTVRTCRRAAMSQAWGQVTAMAGSGQVRGTR